MKLLRPELRPPQAGQLGGGKTGGARRRGWGHMVPGLRGTETRHFHPLLRRAYGGSSTGMQQNESHAFFSFSIFLMSARRTVRGAGCLGGLQLKILLCCMPSCRWCAGCRYAKMAPISRVGAHRWERQSGFHGWSEGRQAGSLSGSSKSTTSASEMAAAALELCHSATQAAAAPN